MRELPPYIYGRECGENEKVLPLEQVLAIQKQAYEDGLRDAAKICDDLAELNRKAMTDSMWQQEECASAIRTKAMLTASQKEAQSLQIDYGVTKPHPFKD